MRKEREDNTPDRVRLDQMAADWICEREMGFGPDREQAFLAWCAADPEHAAAVARAERMSALLAAMPGLRDELEERLAAEKTNKIIAFPTLRNVAGIFAAAAVVLLLALVWGPGLIHRQPAPQRMVAEQNSPRHLTLDDGSRLAMNRNADVRVQLTSEERHIELAAGEVHFDVKPDSSRPFVVKAGGVSVRAVGTAFNVLLGSTGVEVVVTEGQVEVSRGNFDSTVTSSPSARPRAVAGERVFVPAEDDNAPVVGQAPAERLEQIREWRRIFEQFVDVPLRELVSHFNRVNTTQLLVNDPRLAARRMGGTFALSEVDAFVRLLESEGDVIARRGADGVIVLEPVR